MSRKFYPQKSVDLEASPPHPFGTAYKVSVGLEDWGDGEFKPVSKVQMSYDGCVYGRKSPSFPIGSSDEERVYMCIKELCEEYRAEKKDA